MDDGGSPTTGMKKLSNRLMKLFGVDTDDVTEEEIISMVMKDMSRVSCRRMKRR